MFVNAVFLYIGRNCIGKVGYMITRLITIAAAVTGAGFLTIAVLWFIGFLKIRQAWAWLFKD